MSQMAPWVNTLCSYSATSAPSLRGVSLSTRIMLVGRLPSATRNGVWKSGEPSAFEFLGGLAEGQRLGLREQVGHQQVVLVGVVLNGWQKPRKSQGISFVPWWINW